MEIITIIPGNHEAALERAVAVLRAGGLIIYPTETTYGLGADATNPAAIEKLYRYKTQRQGKPLSIVVIDGTMADQYVERNSTAIQAYETFLPGPVTVVSLGRHSVSPGVESEHGTLGVRIPDHAIPIELVRRLGNPITATSANASGQRRPYSVQDILDTTSERQQNLIDLFLDTGTLPPRPPSSVIDTTLDSIQVVRHGKLSTNHTTTWQSHSAEQTEQLGQDLVRQYANDLGYRPVIFALSGPMGAGKTHLTKGIALGVGITELVRSPSYTLMNEYDCTVAGQVVPFVHIDAWRIERKADWNELHVDQYLERNGIVVVEWAATQTAWLESWRGRAQIVAVTLEYGEQTDDRILHGATL